VKRPRRAQGIVSILVASMCRYRTIILRGASSLRQRKATAWVRLQAARCRRLLLPCRPGSCQARKRDYGIQTSLHDAIFPRNTPTRIRPFPYMSLLLAHSQLTNASAPRLEYFAPAFPSGHQFSFPHSGWFPPRISSPAFKSYLNNFFRPRVYEQSSY
jgi:hypothetical protein